MSDVIYQQIERSVHFQQLVRKRQIFAVSLSLIILTLYIGFILLIAFAPGWLGAPLYAGTNVSRGIPLGTGLIVISFVLTGLYVWRANGEFDRLTTAIINEVKS